MNNSWSKSFRALICLESSKLVEGSKKEKDIPNHFTSASHPVRYLLFCLWASSFSFSHVLLALPGSGSLLGEE